ncbi:hypothetical protein PA598K_01443 [Paenibacillus sp. 598K]|uniref:hypothetical protein n=1 Tax=Paenibacillus sp. 598K TaxID=1117987 RepID=UPI000FFA3012|nr:hypothetical protein [Paenibacillus sp. 598K]GBF73158.1 hypothetical protein PA598K_01443 [Paenibacillus sp. 598K]
MHNEIKIKLTPEQRFLIEVAKGEMLVMVDEILYFGGAEQIGFSGKAFNIDYEDMTLKESTERVHVGFEMNEISVHEV